MKKTIPDDAVLIPESAVLQYRGVIFDVYQWSQSLFDVTHTTFEMLRRPDTVVVICVVDNKIIAIKDEQPHSGMKLSFPGGRVDDDDEDILATAKRECLEETGYEFNDWKILTVWQPQSKIEWFIHLFIAQDVNKRSATKHDAGELIIVDLLAFDDVKKLALDQVGHLGDAKVVFEKSDSLEAMTRLPEFNGKVVQR